MNYQIQTIINSDQNNIGERKIQKPKIFKIQK